MQTKLLLAALAANSVNATMTKALGGERTQEVADKLKDIYTRCKAHFEGVNFEVKTVQVEGQEKYAGRVSFSLLEANDCPALDISIQTSIQNKDETLSKVIQKQNLTVEQVKKLADGEPVADLQLFSGENGWENYLVELRATPKELGCGIPFDVVVDRKPTHTTCKPDFRDLKGHVGCDKGVCEKGARLKNFFYYQVSGWNEWACLDVRGKITATSCLTKAQLGSHDLKNSAIKAQQEDNENYIKFTVDGTYEPVCWNLEFTDQGKTIGELNKQLDSPHPPCKVQIGAHSGHATSRENDREFDLTLNVNSTAPYNCGKIERKYNFSDCTTVLVQDSDDMTAATIKKSVNHSFKYDDLPQKYCAKVSYVEERLGPVGEIDFDFVGSNECRFGIDNIQLTNERQEDWSQKLSVTGTTTQSISCPKFNLEVQYWKRDPKEKISSKNLSRVNEGDFSDSVTVPEMFGNFSVKVIMTADAQHSKYAESNVIHIEPEECEIKVENTLQYAYDHASEKVTIKTQNNLKFTEHWCDLDQIKCSTSTNLKPEIIPNEANQWERDSLIARHINSNKTFNNVDFCYETHSICKYTAPEKFPGQKPRESASQADDCHVGQCTLKSLNLRLGNVQSPEHHIRKPNYKVASSLDYNIEIDQFDNCPELLVDVTYQFSKDGIDFEQIGSYKGGKEDIKEGIKKWHTQPLDELGEQKDGYYRVCEQIQKVEPALYERPISQCSNTVRHKPECEYEIGIFRHATTRPNKELSSYIHDFEFEGFQNKWCGQMLATTKVYDPDQHENHAEQNTNDGEKITFGVPQHENFINGEYSALLTWRELESASFKEQRIQFPVTKAGNWCSENISFVPKFEYVTETEKWNLVQFKSTITDFKYPYICQNPVFTIEFQDKKRNYTLNQHHAHVKDIDQVFDVHNPESIVYNAFLSFTADPRNGGRKSAVINSGGKVDWCYEDKCVPHSEDEDTEVYVPICEVFDVNHEKLDIKYGEKKGDKTILSLSLESIVKGNCGDNVEYTIEYEAKPFNIVNGEKQDLQSNGQKTVVLKATDKTYSLDFNPVFGYNVDFTYTVDAINRPRKDKQAIGQDRGAYTVSEKHLCVMSVDMEEISFGENSYEMLEAVYDIKCKISGCLAPFAKFSFHDTNATSSESNSKNLRDDEIQDCIRETARITEVVKNEKGCYQPSIIFKDDFEPVEAKMDLPCKDHVPICHTHVQSFVKKGERLNFDETKVAIDLHFKLESHPDRYCSSQKARFEFKDQNDKAAGVHQIDLTEIQKAKSDDGFIMTFELDNVSEITSYSAHLTYSSVDAGNKAHTKSIPQVFTYTANSECRMEVESFTLDSLKKVANTNDYEAVFEIMTHVTDACRKDFKAQINFIHNDKFTSTYVVTSPESIYRQRNDGRESEIKMIVKELGDVTGEFYGQIEMTAAGKYHISDSASLMRLQ